MEIQIQIHDFLGENNHEVNFACVADCYMEGKYRAATYYEPAEYGEVIVKNIKVIVGEKIKPMKKWLLDYVGTASIEEKFEQTFLQDYRQIDCQ